MNQKTINTAKYGGTSGLIGGSIVVILSYAFSLRGVNFPAEVVAAMTALTSFLVNIILVKSGVISE